MGKIYQILNDVDIDLDEYKDCELSDIEKKQMKKNIKNKLKGKNFNKKRKVAVAAAVFLGITFMSPFVGKNVLANIKLLGISIEEFMQNKSSTLKDYKAVIDKDVKQNDVSIKLNEFILDGNQVVISSTINSDKVKWKESAVALSPQIYINDKNVMAAGGGGSSKQKKIDDSTCGFLNFLILNDKDLANLKGDLHVKIVYDTIFNGGNELKGNWTFEFNYNKDKILKNIKTVPINRTLNLDSFKLDNAKVNIENLRISPIATTLNFTQTDERKYNMSFIVKDQDGNEVKWFTGSVGNGPSCFIYDTSEKNIRKLKITPVITVYKGEKRTGPHEVAREEDYTKVLQEQTFEVNMNR